MSGRVKVMKRMVEPNAMIVRGQLPQIRTKIPIGQQSELHISLMEFLKTLNYKYGTIKNEDDTVNEEESKPNGIGHPYKIKCAVGKAPPGLLTLINYFAIDKNIPMSDIERIVVSIYPPPKRTSDYENTIEPALMITRDRCIYFANSDELIHYKMIDASKVQQLFGMAMPPNAMNSIPEHIERGNGYHFIQTSAVALSIKYNDLSTFQIAVKDGKGTKNKSFEKRPLARYIVVIDFIMTSVCFKRSMKETVNVVADMADLKHDKPEGKMAKSMLEKLTGDSSILEEIPELVELDPESGEIMSSSSVNEIADEKIGDDNVENDEIEDVEEIIIPEEKKEITGYTNKELIDEVGDLL